MLKKRAGRKSFAVFGMGEFGKNVALELAQNEADVLVIDEDEERLKDVMPFVTETLIMDVRDSRSYESINLADMDGVVIAMAEHMDASITAIINAVEAGVEDIVVKALNELHEKIYRKMGATSILIPEKIEGISTARALMKDNTYDYIALDDETCIAELGVHESFQGKTLKELDLSNRFQINVIGEIRNGKVHLVSGTNFTFDSNHHVLIAATDENVRKLLKTTDGLRKLNF